MTYCLAWKTETCAFLITDSATTSTDENNTLQKVINTSFGEEQGPIGKLGAFIYEAAYKIFTHSDIAIGLAGDSRFGTELIDLIKTNLSYGRSLVDAIKYAELNYLDISTKPSVALIFAFYDTEPKVISYSNHSSERLKLDHDFISFGCPPPDLTQYTEGFLAGFRKSWHSEREILDADEIFLVRMIALLQIYGMHNPTMSGGIGGTYTGVKIGEDGLNFQPDICFVVTGENIAFDTKMIVSVHVRNNHYCVINNEYIRVIQKSRTSHDEPKLDWDKAALDASLIYDSGRFKYYIFLNTCRHSASIIQMNSSLHHPLLSIDVSDLTPGKIGIIASQQLARLLNDNYEPPALPKYALITFTRHANASAGQIKYIKEHIDNIRQSRIHGDELDTHRYIVRLKDDNTEHFYGNINSALPIIKHYYDAKIIQAIALATDMVELEYASGSITYPLDAPNLEELLRNIPKKTRPENIFLFEFHRNTTPNAVDNISIFAKSAEDARSMITKEYPELPLAEGRLIFLGTRFYHQSSIF